MPDAVSKVSNASEPVELCLARGEQHLKEIQTATRCYSTLRGIFYRERLA